MFVVRKLPVRSITQATINSVCQVCKRHDLKVLPYLPVHTTPKTCTGIRKNFLCPQRDDKFQIRWKSEISDSDVSDKIVDYKEFNKLIKKDGTVVIDVRDEDEVRRTGSVPCSINVPLNEVKEALKSDPEDFRKKYGDSKPGKDETVVFMCRRGKRSLEALKEAVGEGYTNAKSLDGGYITWVDKERQKKKY